MPSFFLREIDLILVDLSHLLLSNAPLVHSLAPLIFLPILVPETVKNYILNFMTCIVLPHNVQILLCLVARHNLDTSPIVLGQGLNRGIEV